MTGTDKGYGLKIKDSGALAGSPMGVFSMNRRDEVEQFRKTLRNAEAYETVPVRREGRKIVEVV